MLIGNLDVKVDNSIFVLKHQATYSITIPIIAFLNMLCDIILKQVVFLKYYQFLTFVHIILVLEISTNTLSDKNKLCLPFCSLTSFDYVFFKSNMEANITTRLITSSLETTVYLVLDFREITRGDSVFNIQRRKIVTVGSSALQFAPKY